MSSKRPIRPDVLALNAESGKRFKYGQDNMVHELVLPEAARLLTESGEWVVKVSHKGKNAENKRDWTKDPKEAALDGTAYKKNKYEILKHFLGNYIPDSMFLTSTVQEGERQRPAEITIQRRVPNVTLDQLTDAQKRDPRLQENLLGLLRGLQYMYSVIGEVNARSQQGVKLDGKLDLGGVSDFVTSRSLDQQFTEKDVKRAVRTIHSPNLLVDPDTLDLFCIDFDQGDWTPGMDEAKDMVFEIDERRQSRAAEVSHLILHGYMTHGSVGAGAEPKHSEAV